MPLRLLLPLCVLLAGPALAQTEAPAPKGATVVAKSDRLVTTRTPGGATRSYNCKKPENAKKPVCRKK